MKLAQNQVWRTANEYLRIVQLSRLEVTYKAMTNLLAGTSPQHRVSKKAFCRLINDAALLTQAEVRALWLQGD